ncbi:MAG TPA: PBP1A family penicillin-binding protein [bacterium]|nr:PBP1A family penicillin-binding protein [bacterium]HPN45390.1 PBP1A family penicillin-binding protein [bacterium]
MDKKPGWITRIVFILLILFLLVFFIIVFKLPQIPDDLNLIATSNPTVIYADDGEIVKTLTNRQVVSLDQISPDFINAIIALEDVDFYQHHGISKRAVLRAMLVNLKSLRIREGGSTITQQLAKNLFFSFDRTWTRKLNDLFVALQIERQFSKDEIIEAYINQIDFGSGIYGVEMAAQTYFSRHADELSLAQSAMLAGIPRSPYRYNPYQNEERAAERMQFVLNRMLKEQFITEEQMTQALAEKLEYQRINKYFGYADYFTEQIIQDLSKDYDRNAIIHGGLEIFSTINLKYQAAATQAVVEVMKTIDDMFGLPPYQEASWQDKLNYPQVALVVIDPKTGAVKAMVGGRDFQRAPFNRAVANNRMPGSSFKPYTYIAALDKGLVTPKTVYVDEPVSFTIYNQVWQPENFEEEFLGPVTLKWALAKSINVIAAKLINKIGPETTVSYAQKMGITSPMEPHLSLALGATGVSPLEMASAYTTIATQGIRREPFYLQKVALQNDKLLCEHEFKSKQVIDPQTCYIMLDMMKGVVEYGTAQDIRDYRFYRPCAGKTGTTNDHRDAWFIGFTPDLVAAVWVGFDDNRIMQSKWRTGVTGSMAALPIWVEFMKRALANKPFADFPKPPGIVFEEIDPVTGSGPMPGGQRITVALRSGL